MTRIVYVNGQFVPESEAHVSIFDRGFLVSTICVLRVGSSSRR